MRVLFNISFVKKWRIKFDKEDVNSRMDDATAPSGVHTHVTALMTGHSYTIITIHTRCQPSFDVSLPPHLFLRNYTGLCKPCCKTCVDLLLS